LSSIPPGGRDVGVKRQRQRFFACYCPDDHEKVESIVATLGLSSTPVFVEEDYFQPGRKFGAAIQKAIQECQKFIVFWSAGAAPGSNAMLELQIAREHEKPIVVVILDDAPLPPELAGGRVLDFTSLSLGSLEEQDALLSEYTLNYESREFWARSRGARLALDPDSDFFELWVLFAITATCIGMAVGATINPSPAWVPLALGLSVGIVFGPLLSQLVARFRARREMDRWLESTVQLFRDPTAERLRQADSYEWMSPLEAAALLHEELRA
jgi:hypothetical protein